VKQELAEASESLNQLRTVRQGLQEVARELADLREQAQAVKQGLREAGQALGHLHQIRTVQVEVQDAEREAAGIKEPLGSVKQTVEEIQSATAEIRQEMETTREDLKTRMREAGAHFFTIGEACQDLKREVNEAREQIKTLPSGPLQATTFVKPARPPEGKDVQATIVDEHGAPIESEPHCPEMELDHPTSAPEGKKLLGVTVGPDAAVVEVLPDSPAKKAGVKLGDVVVSVDGKPIANSEDLRMAIDQTDADKEVLLTVTRGQDTQTIPVQMSSSMELLTVTH
jgi:hypothetical protein